MKTEKTFLETVTDHRETAPDYFIVASDHKFTCDCIHCVTFLHASLENQIKAECEHDEASQLIDFLHRQEQLPYEKALPGIRKLFNEVY